MDHNTPRPVYALSDEDAEQVRALLRHPGFDALMRCWNEVVEDAASSVLSEHTRPDDYTARRGAYHALRTNTPHNVAVSALRVSDATRAEQLQSQHRMEVDADE